MGHFVSTAVACIILGAACSGEPHDYTCEANGGSCVLVGQGNYSNPCGIARIGRRVRLPCASRGYPSYACCVSSPPDDCEQRGGICAAPGVSCGVETFSVWSGCEKTAPGLECCLPRSPCTDRRGICYVGTSAVCAEKLGPGYHAVLGLPGGLCPSGSAATCCMQTAWDECDAHGGKCYAGVPPCPNPVGPYACDRPGAQGGWQCC